MELFSLKHSATQFCFVTKMKLALSNNFIMCRLKHSQSSELTCRESVNCCNKNEAFTVQWVDQIALSSVSQIIHSLTVCLGRTTAPKALGFAMQLSPKTLQSACELSMTYTTRCTHGIIFLWSCSVLTQGTFTVEFISTNNIEQQIVLLHSIVN